ncbi:hypothetical protein [Spiroplasma endosymbiont of Diplazon laetatorius]|uniref:hypothetical protein n=1 Tax=Spiroplasma endosymbiont of Diplazon laetatorius TaxID=3066322 RepID=UPI0030D51801
MKKTIWMIFIVILTITLSFVYGCGSRNLEFVKLSSGSVTLDLKNEETSSSVIKIMNINSVLSVKIIYKDDADEYIDVNISNEEIRIKAIKETKHAEFEVVGERSLGSAKVNVSVVHSPPDGPYDFHLENYTFTNPESEAYIRYSLKTGVIQNNGWNSLLGKMSFRYEWIWCNSGSYSINYCQQNIPISAHENSNNTNIDIKILDKNKILLMEGQSAFEFFVSFENGKEEREGIVQFIN